MTQPLLQYQQLAEPIAPYIPVTIDEWAQPIQLPPRAKRPTQYGTFVTMIAPLVTFDQWWMPLQVPVRPRHQLRAEWFVSPWSPIEHNGEPGPPDFVMRVRRRLPYQSHFKVLEPSLFVVPPLESWERPTNQPVFVRKQTRLGWVADVAAWTPGTLTLDKWFQPLQVPKFLRIGIRPEQYVKTLEPSLFVVPALESWHRPTNEPTRPRPQVRLGWIADIASWRPATILTTIDMWGQPLQTPPNRRKGVRPEFYVSTLEPSLFVIPALESWHRTTNEPVRTRTQVRLGWIADVAAWTPGTLTLDKWFHHPLLPVRRTAIRPQYYVTSFEVVPPLESWERPTNQPLRVNWKRLPVDVSPFITFQVNIDWLVDYAVPRRTTKPVQTSGTVEPPTGLNVAVLLSWAAEQAFPHFLRRSPDGYFVEPFPQVQVTVTMDMWWNEPQYPIRQRLAAIQALQEFIPIVIQVTPTPPCPYRPERTDEESVVDLSVDEGGDQAILVDELQVSWMRIDGMDVQMPMRVADIVTGAGRTDEVDVRAGMADETDALAGRTDEDQTREGRTDESDTRAASGDSGDERDNRTDDGSLSADRPDECSE